MKKKLLLLFQVVLLVSLSGCFDLEKVNPNQQNEDTFWVDENALFQGTIATYDALQNLGTYGQDYHINYIGLSDEGTNEYPFEFNALVRFTLDDPTEFPFEGAWAGGYAMIGRAFQVIERVDEIGGPNTPRLAAENKFLVGLAYYNLITSYGERIAYVDGIQSAADRPRRAGEGELWALAENFLLEAIPDLPLASQIPNSEYGRASRGAAQTLLAKIYLQQGKYTEAEPLLQEIVDSDQYQLLENYEDNFTELNIVNSEAVFVVNFIHQGPPGETNWHRRVNIFSPAEQLGGFGDIQATNLMLDAFLEEPDADGNVDQRLDVTTFHPESPRPYYGQPWSWWSQFIINPDIPNAFFKYSEQAQAEINAAAGGAGVIERDGGTDFIIFRYSDVLLLLAETLNQNGKTAEAYQYVDQVRERANMLPLSTAKPGLGQAEFFEQIKHERLVELAGELVRFFDLKRWGMFGPQNAVNDPNFATFTVGQDELFPIPQSELDLNENLVQNPGY